jgi:type I site-specific restriction endonuclease
VSLYRNGREAKIWDWVICHRAGVFVCAQVIAKGIKRITLIKDKTDKFLVFAAFCYHAEDAWEAMEQLNSHKRDDEARMIAEMQHHPHAFQ